MSQNSSVIEGGQKGKARLNLLARALQAPTGHLFEQLGVRTGKHVVDVGCGGGHIAFELARRVGTRAA